MFSPWKPFLRTCSHFGQVFKDSLSSKDTEMEGSLVSWLCSGEAFFSPLVAMDDRNCLHDSQAHEPSAETCCSAARTSLGGARSVKVLRIRGVYGVHVAKMARNVSGFLHDKAKMCGEDVELAQAWVQMDELYTRKWDGWIIVSSCHWYFSWLFLSHLRLWHQLTVFTKNFILSPCFRQGGLVEVSHLPYCCCCWLLHCFALHSFIKCF